VAYPHTPLHAEHYVTKREHVAIKKKTIRAGRELIAVPASWLSELENAQSCWTDHFASRMQYLADRNKPAYEAKYGPDVFFSQGKDGPDKW